VKVDFNKNLRVSATLLGLSFAALTFAYNLYYGAAIPAALRSRMYPFVFLTFSCSLFFLFSCFFSFCGITFPEKKSSVSAEKLTPRGWLGLVSLVPFASGFLCLLFALMIIFGLGDLLIKIIEVIKQGIVPLPS